MIVFLCAALASDPIAAVAKLFPAAHVTEVGGRRALAPIARNGEVGFILAENLSSVPLAEGRTLVAFQLDTVPGIERSAEALNLAVRGSHANWTRVLGVVLVGTDGLFVAKPKGFPLEKKVDLTCVGDFCELGPRGMLHPVKHSGRFVVLEVRAQPESMGSMIPIRVDGDEVVLLEARPHGSAGGLSGCAHTERWADFQESKGVLKAMRLRGCGEGNVEQCAELCEEVGYPMESTAVPVTLSE